MKYIQALFLTLCALATTAQERSPANDSIPFEVRKQAYIYNMAMKYNDPAVARMALYNLIASGTNSVILMDSLALMYFENQQYASAALLAQDIIQINPEDLLATEIAALSFDNLGVKNRAVDYYEKLYLASENLGTLYKVAFLQFELNRHGEALTNAEILAESSKADELKLRFPVDNNRTQQISIRAASVRLQGMVEEARGNTALARDYYQKALGMEPDWNLIKEQIAGLEGK